MNEKIKELEEDLKKNKEELDELKKSKDEEVNITDTSFSWLCVKSKSSKLYRMTFQWPSANDLREWRWPGCLWSGISTKRS